VQISFRYWTILTKANGQTSVTLFWIHWMKLWCSEHSVPDEVQFCVNVSFRKRKNEVAENEIKGSTGNSTEYSNVWSLVCFMCYWNCREDCELWTLRGSPWREIFLRAKNVLQSEWYFFDSVTRTLLLFWIFKPSFPWWKTFELPNLSTLCTEVFANISFWN